MKTYFLVLLFSHLFTDFWVQSDKLANRKESTEWKTRHIALLQHSSIFFFSSIFFLLLIGQVNSNFIKYLILLAVSHYVIDLIKVISKGKIFSDLFLFIVDQLLHVVLIVLTLMFYFSIDIINITFIIEIIYSGNLSSLLNPIQKTFFLLSMIIIITSFGNVLIKILVASIKNELISKGKEENKSVKIGRYIGSLERILTFLGVIAGSWEAVAALYAAKAAMRFSKAQVEPDFAEYFMLGTSISAILGITIGIITKYVLGI